MKYTKVELPVFDYDIHLVECESTKDTNEFKKICSKHLHIDDDTRDRYVELIAGGYTDGGNAFRNLLFKEFMILLLPATSKAERRKIISHELRHVVDRMLEHMYIDDIETAAYITGYLSKYIY